MNPESGEKRGQIKSLRLNVPFTQTEYALQMMHS